MDSFQSVYVFVIYSPSDDAPEVRVFRHPEAADAAFRTWLTLTGVDEDGDSLDEIGRTVDHCVRDGSFYGSDGTRCFVFDREIE